MPAVETSLRFKKAYKKLPLEIQEKVKKALRLLAQDPRHPSLRTKPIQGTNRLYEARVDRNYRMSYERLPGDTLLMRVVGEHDKTLGSLRFRS